MFKGNYNFFDYKYNIAGYTGQDFGGFPQRLYLIISFGLIILLLILFRKLSKEKIITVIRIISIFLIIFYIGKTTWESIYDIKRTGSFNFYLLPFDSCSIVMYAGLIAGFCKGKIKEYATSWLATGCILGGFASMLFLNAFKYYPFFSFGAFYSMIWHFLMVFIGLLIIVTKQTDKSFKMVLKGYLFHLLISIVVIPIDFIFKFDFMMYKDLGSIPIFEDIATKFTNMGLQFINPLMMLLLYFFGFTIIWLVTVIITKVLNIKK